MPSSMALHCLYSLVTMTTLCDGACFDAPLNTAYCFAYAVVFMDFIICFDDAQVALAVCVSVPAADNFQFFDVLAAALNTYFRFAFLINSPFAPLFHAPYLCAAQNIVLMMDILANDVFGLSSYCTSTRRAISGIVQVSLWTCQHACCAACRSRSAVVTRLTSTFIFQAHKLLLSILF